MVKIIGSISFLLFIVSQTFSQGTGINRNANDGEENISDLSFLERSYVGGDVGLNFYNRNSYLNISPFYGYYLTNNLSAGAGLKYQFYSNGTGFRDHMYGGSLFSRYDIGQRFFLHAEIETVNTVNRFDPFAGNYGERLWIPMGLLGAGYKYGLGNSFAQILLLYDVIDNRNSPYRFQYFVPDFPLIFRGGFVFRF